MIEICTAEATNNNCLHTSGTMTLIAKRSLSLVTFLLFSAVAMANITISGIYTGKNLRVSNPVCEDGMGLTVLKVRVNEEIVPFIINDNEVEIDFRIAGIQVGSKIIITIESDEFTRPTVLNPNDLESFRSFDDFKPAKSKEQTESNGQKVKPEINRREEESAPKYR